MRIQNISNTVNFGYNKQLNDTVNKKLENAKGNRELAHTLLTLNRFCNDTEDKLRKAEQAKNQRLVDMYTTLFVNIKPLVTEQLNARFPALNYRKNEIQTYQNEVNSKNIKDEFHWMKETLDVLNEDAEMEESLRSMSDKELADRVRAEQNSSEKIIKPENKITTNQPKTKSAAGAKYVEKFVPTEYSPTGFDSLGGMQEIKEALVDKIIFPLNNPEMAKLDEIEYGKKNPRGELFFGPPGCGKTAIMQALAAESGIPMYNLKIAKAGSKYVNESATNVQDAYEYLAQVAEETGKPVFMVMDEMESMTSKRKGGENGVEDDKLVSTLLQIIEEARGRNVIILGATNCFDQLDDAIKSRFDDKIYIGLPDDETRKSVLKVLLNRRTKGVKLASNEEELAKVVQMTKGFSNRDLTILTDKAALNARKDNRRDMIASDFEIPVRDNQNMKVKESKYQASQTRPAVGFSRNS